MNPSHKGNDTLTRRILFPMHLLKTEGVHSKTFRCPLDLSAASQQVWYPFQNSSSHLQLNPATVTIYVQTLLASLVFLLWPTSKWIWTTVNIPDSSPIHSVFSAFLNGSSIDANPITTTHCGWWTTPCCLSMPFFTYKQLNMILPPLKVALASAMTNLEPCAFAASTENNPDIFSQSVMLHVHDCHHFAVAQQQEITGLEDADVFQFSFIDELQSLSPDTHLLTKAIWSYHCKCKPNGNISKYKSCICVDSSHQQYRNDYWNAYTPIVQWSTVWLIFICPPSWGLLLVKLIMFRPFIRLPLMIQSICKSSRLVLWHYHLLFMATCWPCISL